jgi:hypothetical protein
MKSENIEPGCILIGGRGQAQIRMVLSIEPGQNTKDTRVHYRVVGLRKAASGMSQEGVESSTSMWAFAMWAHQDITEEWKSGESHA